MRNAVSLFVAFVLTGALHGTAVRPYEMEWAGRTADVRTPVYPMTDVDGWTVHVRDAVASLSRSPDHLLFGDGVLRLTYRAAGKNPEMRLRPPSPYVLPPGTDAIQLWIYGNISPAFSPNRVKDTPVTHVYADFIDSEGKRFTVTLSHNNFEEWFIGSHRFTAKEKARTAAGGRFVELVVNGGKNIEDRHIEFNSLCIFKEDLKPLAFKPRPKRGVRIFADQEQGINTGAGRLPFPNADTTIVPAPGNECADLEFRFPKDPARWDDLAFRWKKGEWIRVAVGGGLFPATSIAVNADFKRIGNSIVCDVTARGGNVEEVRFGSIEGLPEARHVPVPYYTFKKWKGLAGRPGVVAGKIGGKPLFIGENFDWTQSGASDVFGPEEQASGLVAANGGVKYVPKTNGQRNDCYERFVWSFSTNFSDVLPEIPNPVSPWKAETAKRTWIVHGAYRDRASDVKLWRDRWRSGLRDMIVTDHEGQWRDGYESFTYRTRTAPGKGGDKGQYDYTRVMIDELGYMYGPYNCFCELAPVNGYWSEDVTARTSDGNLRIGWEWCFLPKPVWQPTACETIVPKIQEKFRFNTAYCDVHTCVPPWGKVDFDARVPGAGTFAQTFYADGEVMLLQRKLWNGPVYSEGAAHWVYCGLTDGNYAQDPDYGIAKNPWLLDFDLMRLHPNCVNFGMGTKSMFYGNAGEPKGDAGDRFIAATIAFGHSPFLIWAGGLWRGTFMVVGASTRYCVADAADIRYGDAQGRLLTTSEAILDGTYRRSQVAVRYSDGTQVFVNGNSDEPFAVRNGKFDIVLPPNGWFVHGDGVLSVSAMTGGHRADCAIAPDYVYLDGRKRWTEFPCGASDGAVLRRMLGDYAEEVILFRASKVALPFAAAEVHALAESGEDLGPDAEAKIAGNTTMLVPRKWVYSWKVIRPKSWKEPLAACAAIWENSSRLPAAR